MFIVYHTLLSMIYETDGYRIRDIVNPTEMRQLIAVTQNGLALANIDTPSVAVINAAIKSNSDAIQYIASPTIDMQRNAVRGDGVSIRLIHNPSDEIIIEAVLNTALAMMYVANPSSSAKLSISLIPGRLDWFSAAKWN